MKCKERITAWANRITGYGEEAPEELLANEANWRVHPRSQQQALSGVLHSVGLVQNVIVNRRTSSDWPDGQRGVETVVDGHLRISLAISEEQPTVPITYVDLSPAEEALTLATLDPLSAMAVADKDQLAALLAEVQVGDAAVQAMLAELAEKSGLDWGKPEVIEDPGAQIDRAEELREKWQTAKDQIWQVGKHRLMCGDSTSAEDVTRLMGGEKAAVVTDPPYGIGVDTRWLSALNVQRGKPPNKSDDRLVNDDGLLDLSWLYGYREWLVFGFPFLARHECYTGLLVWDKRGDGGEGGLGNPIEVAASNAFNGYRLGRHIWAGYVREAGEQREAHPTQKPVGILADAINLVENNRILDPFLGSGTTMVAAEQLGRICYGCEIEPKYVAVALQRMSDMGLTPRLVELGNG